MKTLLMRRDGTVMAETVLMAAAFGVVALLTLVAVTRNEGPQLSLEAVPGAAQVGD